eukprot:scaffold8358_cov102-Isochrysis_galbana.AAC.2
MRQSTALGKSARCGAFQPVLLWVAEQFWGIISRATWNSCHVRSDKSFKAASQPALRELIAATFALLASQLPYRCSASSIAYVFPWVTFQASHSARSAVNAAHWTSSEDTQPAMNRPRIGASEGGNSGWTATNDERYYGRRPWLAKSI